MVEIQSRQENRFHPERAFMGRWGGLKLPGRPDKWTLPAHTLTMKTKRCYPRCNVYIQGQVQMPQSKPSTGSVREVARLSGVSIATVSRALNAPQLVSPGTRERVLAVARQLGYEPSALGRNLVAGRSFLAGLIVPNLAWPLYGQITRGIEDVLSGAGLRTLLASSLDDAGRERAAAESLLGHAVDGGIVIASRVGCGLPSRRGAPWVHLAPEDAGAGPRVELDNRLGGRLAAEHLLALGHRRLAVVGAPGREGRERVEGFLGALSGGPSVVFVQVQGDYSEASGESAIPDLLAGGVPDAIFAAGDLMAVGAMRALRRAGLRVPGDVSLIGFDDAEFAALLDPRLSTVRQPARALGEAAARLLLNLLDGAPHPGAVVLAPELAARESTSVKPGVH